MGEERVGAGNGLGLVGEDFQAAALGRSGQIDLHGAERGCAIGSDAVGEHSGVDNIDDRGRADENRGPTQEE